MEEQKVYQFPKEIQRDRVYDMHSHMAQRSNGGLISSAFAQRLLDNPRLKLGPLKKFLPHNFWPANAITDFLYKFGHRKIYERSRIVGHAVALAMAPCCDHDGIEDRTNSHMITKNDYVLKLRRNNIAKNGNTAIYRHVFTSINPTDRRALFELDRVANEASGIKVLPNTQHFAVDDPRTKEFWQAVASIGIPVLIHTGKEHTVPASIDEYGDPQRLEYPLSFGVNVIAAHAMAQGAKGQDVLRDEQVEELEQSLAMMTQSEHLTMDLAATTGAIRGLYLPHILSHAVANNYTEKVFFATDYPVGPDLTKFDFIEDETKEEIEALRNTPDKHAAIIIETAKQVGMPLEQIVQLFHNADTFLNA